MDTIKLNKVIEQVWNHVREQACVQVFDQIEKQSRLKVRLGIWVHTILIIRQHISDQVWGYAMYQVVYAYEHHQDQ
jgi:hypothetical protein